MLILRALAVTSLMLSALSAQAADCVGQNLLEQIPVAARAKIESDTALVPFHEGNFWRATRDDAIVYLIGTYHLDDPRHDAVMKTLAPFLATAQTLLVEAGPLEKQALEKRIAEDPSVIVNTDGPTLPELLSEQDWQRLSKAVSARGLPSFMAAKFKPWYVSMVLSIPPCAAVTQAIPQGLDNRIITSAVSNSLTVEALEPYDTVFKIFDDMSQKDQLAMILSSLAVEGQADDLAITLADTYFAEKSRMIWELSRYETMQIPGYTQDRADAELAVMESAMLTTRNRAWIPIIEAAAARGPVMAAFGALHLSGNTGVLALLQSEGFTIARLFP